MLQPEFREARYAFAQALTRVGRQDEAREHLKEFQRLRTEAVERDRRADEITALKEQAVAHSTNRQFVPAMQVWLKVIALEPGVARNYMELADVQIRAGRLEDSLQSLVRAADLDGVADVHLRLADVLLKLGRARESDLARETFERLQLEDFRRGNLR
jgi:tetratricopeptide (TPR) repeat protein